MAHAAERSQRNPRNVASERPITLVKPYRTGRMRRGRSLGVELSARET